MSETWIVYKTESMADFGSEERRLMPTGSLTDILAEAWDRSGRLPQVGDRLRDYTNLSNPDNGITHGREGEWVVARMQQFSSCDTDTRIVVCYCQYQPSHQAWEPLRRGAPVPKLLNSMAAGSST